MKKLYRIKGTNSFIFKKEAKRIIDHDIYCISNDDDVSINYLSLKSKGSKYTTFEIYSLGSLTQQLVFINTDLIPLEC